MNLPVFQEINDTIAKRQKGRSPARYKGATEKASKGDKGSKKRKAQNFSASNSFEGEKSSCNKRFISLLTSSFVHKVS